MNLRSLLLLSRTLPFALAAWVHGQVTLEDRLPPDAAERLGLHPGEPTTFVQVLEDGPEAEGARAAAGYDASLDVDRVWVCHAGDDRTVWRVDFMAEPKAAETVLHLYIDADRNPQTGRKGAGAVNGTDIMISCAAGTPRSTVFAPDGAGLPAVPVAAEWIGRSAYLSADYAMGQGPDGLAVDLHVLCHSTTTPGNPTPRMTDTTRRVTAGVIPLSPRPKFRRLIDTAAPWGIDRTHVLEVVRRALARSDVVTVPYDRLELDGFEVDLQTSRRYGHLVRTRPLATASCPAPPGTYHVGFMMYDDGSDQRVAIRIGGELRGVAFADCGNRRDWIYWLQEPVRLNGGETIEYVGFGPGGKHGIGAALFLPEPLPTAPFPYDVRHLTTVTPVGEDGRVLVSWITGMPSPTRFEYGTTPAFGSTVNQSEATTLVHRVVLTDLDPGQTYHGRAIGVRPDGTTYASAPVTFVPRAPQPPPTRPEPASLPLRVRNPHPFAVRGWPVTSGVPFPRGELADAGHVRLTLGDAEVPLQAEVTGRWLDGSVKWVLLSFPAEVPAAGESTYALTYGRAVSRRAVGPGLARREGDSVILNPGPCEFRLNAEGNLVLPNGQACSTRIVPAGVEAAALLPGVDVAIVENGPLRAAVRSVARYDLGEDRGAIRVEQRVETYRGLPSVRLFHTFTVESGAVFTDLASMTLSVPAASSAWELGLTPEGSIAIGPGERLQQRDDREIVAGSSTATPGRLVGSASGDGITVALRDFWQQYPKGFRAEDGALQVDLCPDFEEGFYDAFPFEKEGHQLFYYLREGRYRFRRGMAKTHEILIGAAVAAAGKEQAALLQRPLLAVAPAEWMCTSGAFYDVAPRNLELFRAYEEAVDANIARYAQTRERQRDYGLMNYGDWYGERGANWGNIEYDTQHALFLEFIRSGNEEAFFLGDQAQKHNRDVDTVHFAPTPDGIGLALIHQMGHVGGYYRDSVPGTLGIPQAGGSVSHAWVEGHFAHYFLTGDPRSAAVGRAVADYFCRREIARPYDFTDCRVPGWHLIMTAAAYAATGDPYYLNVSRVVTERVLEAQDREPRPLPDYQVEPGRTHQVGGWSRMMVPGHCLCTPRHRGNAGFMVSVLLSGLKYTHDVLGDPAIKQSIIDGARYLLAECYSADVHGFRYTSCPNMRYSPGCSPLMAEGIARAYRWTREPAFADVLTMALPLGAGGSAYGKGFSQYYRVAPRLLADMAACGLTLNERVTPARTAFSPPAWMAGTAAEGQIVLQAEDFTAQGGGACEIRDDRQGAWGRIITYWHQDIGHWLEWTADIPRDGDYFLRLRYATGSAETRRELRIDGTVPVPAAASLRFPETGGFGTVAAQWQWLELRDAAAAEIPLRLSAGKRTIRLTNLNDGLALDFLVLVPK